MQRVFFAGGALLVGLAVAIGAATGHHNNPYDELARIWLEKATRYQFIHGLALLVTALAMSHWQEQRRLFTIAGGGFLGGTLLFSGSLYFMAFTGIPAGYLTPLGGMCFLAGWLAMTVAGVRLSPRPGRPE